MIPDEIQRTIEFILQSQANAVVRMEETEKHLRGLSESTSRRIVELADSTRHEIQDLAHSTNRQILEMSASTNRQILEMADSTNRLIQEERELTGHQIRELTTSTHKFQDDVKEFIKVVAPILEIQSKRLDRLEGHP